MAERWPVTITDGDGDTITVGPSAGTGLVGFFTGKRGVTLNAAQREELAQALAAASHEADGQVASHG